MPQTRVQKQQLRQRKKRDEKEDDNDKHPEADENDDCDNGGNNDDEDEIIVKNGKTYKKRKDLPDVGYLITYGLPGQEGKSARDPTKPWYTDFVLPGILLLVFVASLVAFHHIPFKPRQRPRFSLADIKARTAEQHRMQQVQQLEEEQMKARREQIEFDGQQNI